MTASSHATDTAATPATAGGTVATATRLFAPVGVWLDSQRSCRP